MLNIFSGCSGLTSVTIPNSVTFIVSSAFSGCSGLTSLTIPNSVTSIGSSAFSGCSGLTSLTIPNSVTSIDNSAFSGCSGLTSIKVEETNPKYDSRNKCNAIIEAASSQLIVGCKNTTIPNSVTSIGSSAFSGCSGLTSVTIPNSVTSIGSSAFSGCSGLTSLDIPNNVISIGDGAFQDCSGLTSVNIGNSVTSIGGYAFRGCSNLTSVTLGNSITYIEQKMFDGCNSLETVNLSNNIEHIARYAFRNCNSLKSIHIPNSVATLSNGVFYGCHELTEVYVGKGIKKIYHEAFAHCIKLQDIYCYATTCPQTENINIEDLNIATFTNCPISKINLHVPAKSVEQYKTLAPWNQFRSIEPIVPTNQLVVLSDAGYATFYDEMYDYLLPTDLKAYIVTNATGEKLNYALIADGERGAFIPSGVGVLLKNKERRADSYVLTPLESTTTYSGANLLHGSDEATTTSADGDCVFYKLAYGPNGTKYSTTLGWFWGDDDGKPFDIEGHKAWLAIPKSVAVKSRPLFYSIDGNAIELELIEEVATDDDDDEWYDLQGRRVDHPSQRGIYIQNGKKVFIK